MRVMKDSGLEWLGEVPAGWGVVLKTLNLISLAPSQGGR